MEAKRSHTHVKDPVGYVRVGWILETLKKKKKPSSMHSSSGNATLSLVAFSGESDPNYP